jgi:uncharacterized protein YuzE
METMNVFYDKKGDVLDVSIGRPKKAITKEIEENVFVRISPKTNKIVGFMILHFQKHFQKGKALPLIADFKLEKALAS